MNLTRGERFALILYAVVLIGFLPPVMAWANSVETRVLGLPFPLFWAALMVLTTSVVMTVAFAVKKRMDR